MKKIFYLTLAIALASFALLRAQTTVSFTPAKDNSLFSGTGWEDNSSGVGVSLYAGEIRGGDVRRAVMAFDLSSIPATATITSATLSLRVTRVRSGGVDFMLHRLTSDWGEAGSNAVGNNGQGVTALSGDATWNCAFHDAGGNCTTSWTTPGGDFVAASSGTTSLAGANTTSIFPSSASLVADVQAWVDGSESNFGWLLKTAETGSRLAKQISSREAATAANRPTLTVTYTVALPVSLTTFQGAEMPNGNKLSWETDQESDFSHFEVQRRTERDQDFVAIGRVNGGMENLTGGQYSFLDEEKNIGDNLYRLKMVDLDGAFAFSPLVRLTTEDLSSAGQLSIWPNPATESLHTFLPESLGDYTLSILSYDGKLISERKYAGNQQVRLTITELPQGQYYLRWVNDRDSGVTPFMKR